MVVRKRIVVYAVVDFTVGIACALGAELPYRPIVAMLGVEELDEGIEGVAVCSLRVCA